MKGLLTGSTATILLNTLADNLREMGQLNAGNKSTKLFGPVYECCETETRWNI